MAREATVEPRTLTRKPLVEAILELRWQLFQRNQHEPPHDPGFRIAIGRFYDKIRTEYSLMVDLPAAQIPEDVTPHVVRHQFRAAKDGWPLAQLGPGILTVNDTEGYTWDSFRPRLLSAFDAIREAYPSEVHPFSPIDIQLRYINAIPLPEENPDPTVFLQDLLHTGVKVDPLLGEMPREVRLDLAFALTQPTATGMLTFATGRHKEKPSIILQLTIGAKDKDTPSNRDSFSAWVDQAHTVIDRWFFTLCRGALLNTFEGSNDTQHA